MAEAPVGRGSAGRPEWTGQGLSRRTGVNDLTPAQKLQKQIDEKYAAKCLRRLDYALKRLRRWNWDYGTGQPAWAEIEKIVEEKGVRKRKQADEVFEVECTGVGPKNTSVISVIDWGRDVSLTGNFAAKGKRRYSAPGFARSRNSVV